MNNTKKLTFSAICLALCIVLPFLTGQIPQFGNMLCPMHFPVLLCGIMCGAPWGVAVGVTAPIMRSLMFGMPPIFPQAVSMAFEMGTYGFICGAMLGEQRKTLKNIYPALLTAMLCGRIVMGIVMTIFAAVFHVPYSFSIFVAGAFVNAWPGILLQLVILPPIMLALQKIRVIE